MDGGPRPGVPAPHGAPPRGRVVRAESRRLEGGLHGGRRVRTSCAQVRTHISHVQYIDYRLTLRNEYCM